MGMGILIGEIRRKLKLQEHFPAIIIFGIFIDKLHSFIKSLYARPDIWVIVLAFTGGPVHKIKLDILNSPLLVFVKIILDQLFSAGMSWIQRVIKRTFLLWIVFAVIGFQNQIAPLVIRLYIGYLRFHIVTPIAERRQIHSKFLVVCLYLGNKLIHPYLYVCGPCIQVHICYSIFTMIVIILQFCFQIIGGFHGIIKGHTGVKGSPAVPSDGFHTGPFLCRNNIGISFCKLFHTLPPIFKEAHENSWGSEDFTYL